MSRTVLILVVAIALDIYVTSAARAVGTLAPTGAGYQSMRVVDHHIDVIINNGFARTEVTQVFENPNPDAVEALFSLPLPKSAALAEMSIITEDQTLYGEVVPRDDAEQIYQEQQRNNQQAGLAVKEGYQRFAFRIASVPANGQVTTTFAYYQSLEIDAGVGRYLYPLEAGGTDPAADAFWNRNQTSGVSFSADFTLKSAWPIDELRLPGFESIAQVNQTGSETWDVTIRAQTDLDTDLVLYYRLVEDLPGRVEVIPYRNGSEEPGTFMMVLTPGTDLEPLKNGADYVFVLDVSGSMDTKLYTLVEAVKEVLNSLSEGDRFRIITFSENARELTDGWVESNAETISSYAAILDGLSIEGGTNLFSGMQLALQELDDDRATGLFLFTDAVANVGTIDGPSFVQLLTEVDVRVFGFLMSNSANWPLMQLIVDTSGGFYAPLSNTDDINGQIMLARNKITHQALHDVSIEIQGGDIFDLTTAPNKVHRGEQMVIFGRYRKNESATMTLQATITGKERTYDTTFDLPSQDLANPELERLWALATVEWLEYQYSVDLIDREDVRQRVEDLGVAYQIVTDETSMLLLTDQAFEKYGIDRDNRNRILTEEEARALRLESETVDYSVDVDPSFSGGSPHDPGSNPNTGTSDQSHETSDSSFGFGGGALSGPDSAAILLFVMVFGWLSSGRRRQRFTRSV